MLIWTSILLHLEKDWTAEEQPRCQRKAEIIILFLIDALKGLATVITYFILICPNLTSSTSFWSQVNQWVNFYKCSHIGLYNWLFKPFTCLLFVCNQPCQLKRASYFICLVLSCWEIVGVWVGGVNTRHIANVILVGFRLVWRINLSCLIPLQTFFMPFHRILWPTIWLTHWLGHQFINIYRCFAGAHNHEY